MTFDIVPPRRSTSSQIALNSTVSPRAIFATTASVGFFDPRSTWVM